MRMRNATTLTCWRQLILKTSPLVTKFNETSHTHFCFGQHGPSNANQLLLAGRQRTARQLPIQSAQLRYERIWIAIFS